MLNSRNFMEWVRKKIIKEKPSASIRQNEVFFPMPSLQKGLEKALKVLG